MKTPAKQEVLLTNKSITSEIIIALAQSWASMLSRPASSSSFNFPHRQDKITAHPSYHFQLGAIAISDYNSVFHSSSRWLFPAFIAGGGGMAFQRVYKR